MLTELFYIILAASICFCSYRYVLSKIYIRNNMQNKQISKITLGNDFTLEIRVVEPQYFEGHTEWEDFNLLECNDIHVDLVCTKDQILIPLEWSIKDDTNNIIICDIKGRWLHKGAVYGLQITGSDANQKAWRYKNKSVFSIVDSTAQADLQPDLMADPLLINAEISIQPIYLYKSYEAMPLTFEALTDDVEVMYRWNTYEKSLWASLNNGLHWQIVKTSENEWTSIASLNKGETLMLMGVNEYMGSDTSDDAARFQFTGPVKLYGNILSVIYGQYFAYLQLPFTDDNQFLFGWVFSGYNEDGDPIRTIKNVDNLIFPDTVPADAYLNMFQYQDIEKAPKLPATELQSYCYYNMFSGCRKLCEAPLLPATSLAYGCYEGMFKNCTSLTEPPKLPATSMERRCYANMFEGCSNLLYAPKLPAFELASNCYDGMFKDCVLIEKAPDLLTTGNVDSSCYANMFSGCQSLRYINCQAGTSSTQTSFSNWTKDVGQKGKFVKNENVEQWTMGNNGIPYGRENYWSAGTWYDWTIYTTVEEAEAGPQGMQGNQGDRGEQGPQGEQGVQGKRGATGVQGNQGEIGPQGEQGVQGRRGATGVQGNQGEIGPQGEQGTNGIDGVQGPQGDIGIQGPQGAPGTSGPTPGFVQYTNNNKTGLVSSLVTYTGAIGNQALVEGLDNFATADYAHVEGNGSRASGLCAHAEGYCTSAFGQYSHAEGNLSETRHSFAHAEGLGTTASGQSAHSEGTGTTASGRCAHAEGDHTQATANYSHAEGKSTITYNESEHAEGKQNLSNSADSNIFGHQGNTLHSIGNGTDGHRHNAFEVRQNGDIYIADTSAIDDNTTFYYNAPTIKLQDALSNGGDNAWQIIGTGMQSSLVGDNVYSTIGAGSIILGGEGSSMNADDTLRCDGDFSMVMGYKCQALQDYSFVIGSNNKSSSNRTLITGQHNTINTSADESLIVGSYNSVTSSRPGYLIGRNLTTTQEYETGIGRYNTGSRASDDTGFGHQGNTLLSVGNGNNSNRHNAFEVRQNGDIYIADTSSIDNNTTFYYNTPMLKLQDALSNGGDNAWHIVGAGMQSSLVGDNVYSTIGAGSIILGGDGSSMSADDTLRCDGDFSMVMGYKCQALQDYSFVIGSNNKSSSHRTLITGQDNTINTSADGSLIVGSDNSVTSSRPGYLIGRNLTTTQEYETGIGRYNTGSRASGDTGFGHQGNTLLSVGNGSGNNSRHNAFEVRQNGDIYIVDTSQIDGSTVHYYDAPTIKLQDALGMIDYSKKYLTFEIVENGTVTIKTTASTTAVTISFSTDDGLTWTSLTTSTTTQSLGTFNVGDTILVKGTNNRYAIASGSTLNYNNFNGTAKFNLKGNIMSLCYGDNFIGQTSLPSGDRTFNSLFIGSNIIDASDLILPATSLTGDCYGSMFKNCTLLKTAPALPAKTLPSGAYLAMFSGCTSLKTAPELPATSFGQYSVYSQMFLGCTSLENVPKILPATSLNYYCYERMFEGCTSLTEAPELPATSLRTSCYEKMFYGCTKLKYVKCSATSVASNNISNWLYNVSPTGVFITETPNIYPTGASGIPSGWITYTSSQWESESELVYKYELATVAITGSYNSLTNTPTIPDTTGMVTSTTNGLKIEVVSSLPVSPDSNTIYIVQ